MVSGQERALATGIFNAGANIGAIVTPAVVPFIVVSMGLGWRMAFIITGAASLVWLVAWIVIYRRPREQPRVSAAELAYIESDPADPAEKIGWLSLLGYRGNLGLCAGQVPDRPDLVAVPVLDAGLPGQDLSSRPGELRPAADRDLSRLDLGSVAGGWSSSTMMKRGFSANAARKLTMLACAFLVMPIFFAQYVDNLWLAVGIVGLATAAHQAFSANLYTIPSDMFPRGAVGSVVGIGGTVGAVGGMGMAWFTGYILQTTGSYTLIFAVAGSVYS